MPFTTRWICLAILVLGLGMTSSAQAQLSLRASHAGSAHPPLSGGSFALQGTAGQPAVSIAGDGQPLFLGSGFWYAARNAEVALPVDLVSFSATISGEAAELVWQTASETGNTGFRVERARGRSGDESSDASGLSWVEIGSVEGAGTTSAAQSYRFRDAALPFEARTLHYRLRQVDVDGTETLSDPIRLALGAPDALRFHPPYPNPATTQVTVRYELPTSERVRLELFDTLGRRVRTLVAGERAAGRVEARIPTVDLASGLYFVRLVAGDRVRTQRFTVVR